MAELSGMKNAGTDLFGVDQLFRVLPAAWMVAA